MLACENLRLTRNHKAILKGISLNFQPGTVHGILGSNGSGKSSLLKCLAGIWKGESGTVTWQGVPLDNFNSKERARFISLVQPTFHDSFSFTVREIVGMGRFCHYTKPQELLSFIEKSLLEVDALEFIDRKFASLSTGEKHRVLIARALATESPVLLLDEPTSALDIRHELEIWMLLSKLAKQGKVIILTLHNLEQAKRFLERAVLLKNGSVVADDSPESALTPTLIATTFDLSSDFLHQVG